MQIIAFIAFIIADSSDGSEGGILDEIAPIEWIWNFVKSLSYSFCIALVSIKFWVVCDIGSVNGMLVLRKPLIRKFFDNNFWWEICLMKEKIGASETLLQTLLSSYWHSEGSCASSVASFLKFSKVNSYSAAEIVNSKSPKANCTKVSQCSQSIPANHESTK